MTRPEQQRRAGLFPATGSTEGFYRSWAANNNNPQSNLSSRTDSNNNDSMDPRTSTISANRDSVDGVAEAQTMDRTVDGNAIIAASVAARPGSLKAPAELGRQSPSSVEEGGIRPSLQKNASAASCSSRQIVRHPAAHNRIMQAVKSTMTKAAVAAAAEAIASISRPPPSDIENWRRLRQPSMIASMAYQGMEVIFATCVEPDGEWSVYGILARTRVIFQTLTLPDPYVPVVSLLSNPETGLVAVAQANATVQTYVPVATRAWPAEGTEDPPRPVTTLGRYLWKDGSIILCNSIFCRQLETEVVFENRRNAAHSGGAGVDVSSSSDNKVLVAFRNQVAVFDASRPDIAEADLVWTTRLDHDLITAKFSGDGLAIAVVVKGEGVENDNPFGIRTFLRDEEDGSDIVTSSGVEVDISHPAPLERSKSIGVIYRSGPFLVHTAPVSRISFRGHGHVTSNVLSSADEGNDLLLTYCNEDCSVRVFNQNGWKQLMHWTTPPNSRADWVKGISAFTLGDLDSLPTRSKFTSSTTSSRRTSFSDTDEGPSSGDNGNFGTRPYQPAAAGHPAPSSAAGAWIVELTFRNAFPALRLSRLSYMKRGDDDVQPSHFESVAAILPAGSIVAGGVIDGDDLGLSVHGVWPAWNPCTAGGKEVDIAEPMTGSAMTILGLSALSQQPSGAYFGQTALGGTHSPPSELKIIASHPLTGKVLIMEFPLWGDRDLGAMELGSPLRYLLSLSDVGAVSVGRNLKDKKTHQNASSVCTSGTQLPPPVVSVEYESSRLCAQIESDCSSVAITWRRSAGIAVLPKSFVKDGFESSPFVIRDGNQSEPTLLQDMTNISVPLALPPLRLPHCTQAINRASIVAVCWWPDENFGGPPLLLVVTSTGTILVFEIPPPWCAMEPSMPSYDPSVTDGSIHGGDYSEVNSVAGGSEVETDNDSVGQVEYEVSITPDPDFGLGLRLESYEDSMPAVVGSFKKHPLHGGRLPAEKSGKISLGDELLFVNKVDLEGMTFDNVIETVRRVGAETGPGTALFLRFRRSKKPSIKFQSDGQESPKDSNRRTAEQIFGFHPKRVDSGDSSISSGPAFGTSSQREPAYKLQNRVATVLVGVGGESQQEFSRIVAIVDRVLPDLNREGSSPVQSRILLSPWSFGDERLSSESCRGSSVLIYAHGRKIVVERLDIASDCDPEKARLVHIGSVKLGIKSQSDAKANGKASIQQITSFETGKAKLCLAACCDVSEIRLVFVDFSKGASTGDEVASTSLNASFREYLIIQLDQPPLLVRAFSPGLFATLGIDRESNRQSIKVWSPTTSFPSLDATKSPEAPLDYQDENCYVFTKVAVPIDPAKSVSSQNEIIDVVFTCSGCLDAYPWLVAFSRVDAAVYQRHSGNTKWSHVLKVSYAATAQSRALSSSLDFGGAVIQVGHRIAPIDAFPHLLPSLKIMIASSDESNRIRSDWHPESLLACLFTEPSGVKEAAKGKIRNILLWVAQTMKYNESGAYFQREDPLYVMPSTILRSKETRSSEAVAPPKDYVFGINFSKPLRIGESGTDESLLRELQKCLQEKKQLPLLLQKLTRNERKLLRVLVELVVQPPNFGMLDLAGQMTLLCVAILRQIHNMPDDPETATKRQTPTWPVHHIQGASFSQRQQSNASAQKERNDESILASSGVLSALISSSQGLLLEECRLANEKLDWARARELRLPFWIRSDQLLRKISEEIGQRSYKQGRDIMESALFFVAVRNMRTLRNLAATDSSDSGRKFFNFITGFDFSTERGRRAAEKNAYSLLRKRRYLVAATFFLLPDPPLLNSAIETIATKMEDLDLAFFVTRLIESSNNKQSTNSFQSIANMMGGGGGYASNAEPTFKSLPEDAKYSEWKPCLSKAARQLLLDRGISSTSNDRCLTAVQLMWLGQPEKGSQYVASNESNLSSAALGLGARLGFPRQGDGDSALDSTKDFIDFSSTPFILSLMGASSRSRWASSLHVANELSLLGIELPSIRTLLEHANHVDWKEEESSLENAISKPKVQPGHTSLPASSIFDQYDAGPPRNASSSIFDSFDAMPPSRSKQTQAIQPPVGANASSIFDSFDAPVSVRSTVPKAQPISSSIFDSFDVPTIAPRGASQAEKATTSIFAAFDAPIAPASSIFDAFDVPVSARAPPAPHSTTSTSSIFDSFDVPHAAITPKQQMMVPTDTSTNMTPANSENLPQLDSPSDPPLQDFEPATRIPPLWLEWRESLLMNVGARRLIREVVGTVSLLYNDLFDSSRDQIYMHSPSEVPPSVEEILHRQCDGKEIITTVRSCIDDVCQASGLHDSEVLDEALHLLATPCPPRRTVLAVLLHCAAGREDLAEDCIRHLAHGVIQYCEFLALANDDVVNSSKALCQFSSACLRRRAASASWQLEICLWLHRGGAFQLSQIAVSEAIVAVRCGLVIAAWNRSYDCLDTLLRCEPDCEMDRAGGSQLWGSLKILVGSSDNARKRGSQSNGGWEFLVETRRAGATEMLKSKATGCFIIRPHRDDDCVFTLSFKTNLVPTVDSNLDKESATVGKDETAPPKVAPIKVVKEDDVVQHAVIRLSDSGFRCGSFGPFPSLMQLLEAVSSSLPFPLRFDQPPVEGLMGGSELSQPSPNAVFLRKLVIDSHADTAIQPPPSDKVVINGWAPVNSKAVDDADKKKGKDNTAFELRRKFGLFAELLLLSEIRKQLSSIAAAAHEFAPLDESTLVREDDNANLTQPGQQEVEEEGESDDDDSLSESTPSLLNIEMQHSVASRTLRPLLVWCRAMEISAEWELAPALRSLAQGTAQGTVTLSASETAIELANEDVGSWIDGGDAVLRRMIQPGSGVEFRTLKLGEGGQSAVVVLFSQAEAIEWFMSTGAEATREAAIARLKLMESRRVIEPVDLKQLGVKAYSANKGPAIDERGIRYRFVDPWEVEAVGSKEGEIKSASLGREHLRTFDLNIVSKASEAVIRSMGGVALLKLWNHLKGGIALTKAIASVYPPWERGAGGDLQVVDGTVNEPSAFLNCVRQHLYRNALFRRLETPQRFMALIQIELLDLKNLTSPLGMSALTVYALLRLKRGPSGAPLTNKARTLDSVATLPMKLGKTSGPNAPASWGSVVRFRFPLPEDVTCDAVSYDCDCEALFKGPPCVLQISVYEKKFMTDTFLGGADVKLDDLSTVGQLEEWVPLRVVKHGISVNWFARIRLTLRFELMCLHPLGTASASTVGDAGAAALQLAPSVGLRRIRELSRIGGADEDIIKKSSSTPDLLGYFENMTS